MKKYVVGVDVPVLASVKIAKNAQLVAKIKYTNFGVGFFCGGLSPQAWIDNQIN